MQQGMFPAICEWKLLSRILNIGFTINERKEEEKQIKIMAEYRGIDKELCVDNTQVGRVSGDKFRGTIENCFSNAFTFLVKPFERQFIQEEGGRPKLKLGHSSRQREKH